MVELCDYKINLYFDNTLKNKTDKIIIKIGDEV